MQPEAHADGWSCDRILAEITADPGRTNILANIPAFTTKFTFDRNQHLQNKTPEEDLRGAG